MSSEYRLTPAHRRQLRRARALVEAASSTAGALTDVSVSPESLASAHAYLTEHASCEAYLVYMDSGGDSPVRPRCAQRWVRPRKGGTPPRTCSSCGKRKPAYSVDAESGVCIKCKYKALDAGKARQAGSSAKKKVAAATKRQKCPHCLQGIVLTLSGDDWIIEPHLKGRGAAECRLSGMTAFRQKRDAMDYTVGGSFEGGKRR